MEEGGVYPHFADKSSEARQSSCDFAGDHRPFNGSRSLKPFFSVSLPNPVYITCFFFPQKRTAQGVHGAPRPPGLGHTDGWACAQGFKPLSFLSGFTSQRCALSPASEHTGHFHVLGVGGEDVARGDHAPGVLGLTVHPAQDGLLAPAPGSPRPSNGHCLLLATSLPPQPENLHSTPHTDTMCFTSAPQTCGLQTGRVLIISES